jgi:DNA-binding transcriptional MocR family regulator
MVTPTYHLAARILEDAGFATRLRGIPEDEEGIDLVSLENGLRAAEADAERAGNTTPVGQVANVTVALHRGIDSLPD